MQVQSLSMAVFIASLCSWSCSADEILFEDNFDKGLSPRWKLEGLTKDDYRIRDGGLELRVLPPAKEGEKAPMMKVDLPFRTSDSVIASVDVSIVGSPLPRGGAATLLLTDSDGESFSVEKTNIHGFFVFAPGEVEFIGKSGEEGDPGKYTIKYWPADKEAGPLRIIVRGHYAFFQVGPSASGEYKTFFHSAITEASNGMGFGLRATSAPGPEPQWVRFDNFRVTR